MSSEHFGRRDALNLGAMAAAAFFLPRVESEEEGYLYTPGIERKLCPETSREIDNTYGYAVAAANVPQDSPHLGEKLVFSLYYEDLMNRRLKTKVLDAQNQIKDELSSSISFPEEWGEVSDYVECIPHPSEEGYLVAYSGYNQQTSKWEIVTQRVDLDGNHDAQPTRLIDDLGFEPERFKIVNDTTNNRYLVVWQRDWNDGGLGGQVVTNDGITIGSLEDVPKSVGSGMYSKPSFIYDPSSNCYYGSWIFCEDINAFPTVQDVLLASFTPDGTLITLKNVDHDRGFWGTYLTIDPNTGKYVLTWSKGNLCTMDFLNIDQLEAKRDLVGLSAGYSPVMYIDKGGERIISWTEPRPISGGILWIEEITAVVIEADGSVSNKVEVTPTDYSEQRMTPTVISSSDITKPYSVVYFGNQSYWTDDGTVYVTDINKSVNRTYKLRLPIILGGK